MAFVKMERCFEPVNTCGGFLIQEDGVVMAAHCRVKGSKDTVVLGAHNISNSKPRRQKIRVRCWIHHPKYNKTAPNNDITLLQVPPQSHHSAPRDLMLLQVPPRSHHPAPSDLTLLQVPPLSHHPAPSDLTLLQCSDVLREVALEVMADDACEHNLTKPYDAESMICAGYPRGRRAALKGDLGGPLVCDRVPQGIVSWGPSNGASPQVYARVSRFVSWIWTVIKQLKPLDAPGISSRA
nr:granzyme B-like [Caretta caretta]